jgi:hypothetical protein
MTDFDNDHGNDAQLAQYDAISPVDEEDLSSVSSETHGTENTEDDPTTTLAVGTIPRDYACIALPPPDNVTADELNRIQNMGPPNTIRTSCILKPR